MYIVIDKIELNDSNDGLKFSEYGYTSDTTIQKSINDNYDSSIGIFIGDNQERLYDKTVNISIFFSENNVEHVYVAKTEVYDSEEVKGVNITNINQL